MASTTFVDGETLIEASWLNDVNAAVYTPGTIDAANVSNTPAGNLGATTVQAALNELDAEKQPLDATLTAIAALDASTGLVEQTGADTFTKTPVSAFAKTLLDDADAATARATLGTNDAANITTGNLAAARIMTALNASGSAPVYACRAWVHFDGTSTVAIRASGNVSSITDNGVGHYVVNFTTAMQDTFYAVHAQVGNVDATGLNGETFVRNFATTSITVFVNNSSGAGADYTAVSVSVFR